MIEYRHVMEHIEVYKNGEFVVSADNRAEAEQFLEELGVKED